MDKFLPFVKVVTSVFNGEKYIKEQVDSVLKQTYPNFELYIRDNCSTDNTLKVLQEYEKHPKVHIIKGDKNLGPGLGYFTLLDLCGDADYYAFCDSDDVWPENKLEIAVEMLELENDSTIPVLYASRYDICDENLTFICERRCVRNISFQNCMIDDPVCTSSTAVFNKQARDMLIEKIPQNVDHHDFWLYMLCQGLGKVIYDPRSLMKYRRHGSNFTAICLSKNRVKIIAWKIKWFLMEEDWWNMLKNQIQEFSNLYGDKLCEEDYKTLELFTNKNIVTTLKKVFYPKMFTQDIKHEIMQRITFLLGKI